MADNQHSGGHRDRQLPPAPAEKPARHKEHPDRAKARRDVLCDLDRNLGIRPSDRGRR